MNSWMQLQLFSRPKPLVERFGAAFFRELPKQPGVYLMRDCADRLLYVGKAGDLRQRLGSYRYVTDRTSRRVLRLLSCVAAITWEVHDSEPAACLRENELLRTHRPRFNRANVYPQAYPFIELKAEHASREEGLLSVHLRLVFEPNEGCYGAFKGARTALLPLLRLLHAMEMPGHSYGALPRRLLLERAPAENHADASWRGVSALRDFLAGNDDRLTARAKELPPEASVFHEQFRAADLEVVQRFYKSGPKRNREWLASRGLDRNYVEQEQLNDLAVLARPAPSNAGRLIAPG